MEKIATIGMDIAKSMFKVHGVDPAGEVLVRKRRFAAKAHSTVTIPIIS